MSAEERKAAINNINALLEEVGDADLLELITKLLVKIKGVCKP